ERHGEAVDKRLRNFGWIEKILSAEIVIGIVRSWPGFGGSEGIEIGNSSARPAGSNHRRTGGVTVNEICSKSPGANCPKHGLHTGKSIEASKIPVSQQRERVVESNTAIGQRVGGSGQYIREIAIWTGVSCPDVGIKIDKKRREVDFPRPNTLIAQEPVP